MSTSWSWVRALLPLACAVLSTPSDQSRSFPFAYAPQLDEILEEGILAGWMFELWRRTKFDGGTERLCTQTNERTIAARAFYKPKSFGNHVSGLDETLSRKTDSVSRAPTLAESSGSGELILA
jgi:hypothetical protein